jgi:hypothetical protein
VIVSDLAAMLALGGDCLADVAVLRAEPQLFGPGASDPVVLAGGDARGADGGCDAGNGALGHRHQHPEPPG